MSMKHHKGYIPGILVGVFITLIALSFIPGLGKQVVNAEGNALSAGTWIASPVAFSQTEENLWLFNTDQKQILVYRYEIASKMLIMSGGRDIRGDIQVVNALKTFPVPKLKRLVSTNFVTNVNSKEYFKPQDVTTIIEKLGKLVKGRNK
jgi:hypothetical protein